MRMLARLGLILMKHKKEKPVIERSRRSCAHPQLERSGKRRRILLNEALLQRSAEVQLRAAAQTGRAINQCLNSASINSGFPPILKTSHSKSASIAQEKCDSIFARNASLSHAEIQFHPTQNPRRGGGTETPPASISHSGPAAPQRQPSRRTRMERASGKKRDFYHLPVRSPTLLREKFPASSHLPPPSVHHSHFILLQKTGGKNMQSDVARKGKRGGERRTGSFGTEE